MLVCNFQREADLMVDTASHSVWWNAKLGDKVPWFKLGRQVAEREVSFSVSRGILTALKVDFVRQNLDTFKELGGMGMGWNGILET